MRPYLKNYCESKHHNKHTIFTKKSTPNNLRLLSFLNKTIYHRTLLTNAHSSIKP